MNIPNEIHMLWQVTRPIKPIPSTYCPMTYRGAYSRIDIANITRSKMCQFYVYKNELCSETFTQYLISWGIHFPKKYVNITIWVLYKFNTNIPLLLHSHYHQGMFHYQTWNLSWHKKILKQTNTHTHTHTHTYLKRFPL